MDDPNPAYVKVVNEICKRWHEEQLKYWDHQLRGGSAESYEGRELKDVIIEVLQAAKTDGLIDRTHGGIK